MDSKDFQCQPKDPTVLLSFQAQCNETIVSSDLANRTTRAKRCSGQRTHLDVTTLRRIGEQENRELVYILYTKVIEVATKVIKD